LKVKLIRFGAGETGILAGVVLSFLIRLLP